MRIQAEEHRLYWKIIAVGFAVDLVGAAVIAAGLEKLLGPARDDSFLEVAFWVWLAIQAGRFLITLLNLARLWAAKEMGAFKASREAFLTALRENDFPNPGPYASSVDAYLNEVVDDDSQSTKARVAGACLYGVRQGTKNLGIWHAVLLDSAHEDALKRFAESWRERSS